MIKKTYTAFIKLTKSLKFGIDKVELGGDVEPSSIDILLIFGGVYEQG